MVQGKWKTTTHAETKLKEKYVMDTLSQLNFHYCLNNWFSKKIVECGKDQS